MSKLLRGILGLGIGYLVGAGTGVVLVTVLSANSHDKSLEMAMTSAFVTGPIGALIGLVIALFMRRG